MMASLKSISTGSATTNKILSLDLLCNSSMKYLFFEPPPEQIILIGEFDDKLLRDNYSKVDDIYWAA